MKFNGISSRNSTKRSCAQHGGGSVKAIVYTAIFVILIFVAYKIVPPFAAEYQLTDKMQEQARFATVNKLSDEQLRDVIFKTVQDLDIPAKREDIKIKNTQAAVQISVNYTVPVDFMIYSTELHFSPSSENKSIMN